MNRRLAAILFAIVFPSIVTLVYFVWLDKFPPSTKQIAYGIGKTIQFGFPIAFAWVFHRGFLRREQSARENRAGPSNRDYIIGACFGALVVTAMMSIYFLFLADSEFAAGLLEKVKQKTFDSGIDSPLKCLVVGIFYALVHSFLEEYYFRWFVFGQLKTFVPVPIASLISSLGFMAHHVILLAVFFESWTSPLVWLFSAAICIGGTFWAWLYQRSGSLKAPWLSHLVVDAGIFTLGYLMIRHLFQA